MARSRGPLWTILWRPAARHEPELPTRTRPTPATPSLNGLALLAALALLLGAAVYLSDRPAGSAWLLPAAWQARWQAWWPAPSASGWFGSAGLWLPSFVHAFAFSVLTAWLLPARTACAAAACGGWALIDTLAELGQHASVSQDVAATVAALHGDGPLALHIARYFTGGSFSVADLAAALAGSAAAFVAVWCTIAAAHRRVSPFPAFGR